ncbi:hypothetical protein HHI36_002526 [Cryptolaemus montrouzieri]|uniref:UPAR/Ly6 domain-containing protein qvr n=1 Tax=Cryptolaemus montrouzieri TaxID=559131 RepID=A0ABD2PB26_9CUCU
MRFSSKLVFQVIRANMKSKIFTKDIILFLFLAYSCVVSKITTENVENEPESSTALVATSSENPSNHSKIVTLPKVESCSTHYIYCYECDSYTDLRCGNINKTDHPKDQPPLVLCHGCCVKMVRNANKSNEIIRRTCTSNLYINISIADHLCIPESNTSDRMCYCDDDLCNSSSKPSITFSCLSLIVLFVSLCTLSRP